MPYSPYLDSANSVNSIAGTIAQYLMMRPQQELAAARAQAEAAQMAQQMQLQQQQMQMVPQEFALRSRLADAQIPTYAAQTRLHSAQAGEQEAGNALASQIQQAQSFAGAPASLQRNVDMQTMVVNALRQMNAFPQGQTQIPLADLVAQSNAATRGGMMGSASRNPGAAVHLATPMQVPTQGVDVVNPIDWRTVVPSMFPEKQPNPYTGRPQEQVLEQEAVKTERAILMAVGRYAESLGLDPSNPTDAAQLDAYEKRIRATRGTVPLSPTPATNRFVIRQVR